jgi:hypothetical protein
MQETGDINVINVINLLTNFNTGNKAQVDITMYI